MANSIIIESLELNTHPSQSPLKKMHNIYKEDKELISKFSSLMKKG